MSQSVNTIFQVHPSGILLDDFLEPLDASVKAMVNAHSILNIRNHEI